jgi:hypothetical protein
MSPTSNFLTHKHATNAIRLVYESAGFIVENGTPGQAVSNEFKFDVSTSPLASLYTFIDEYIALLRYATYYFASAINRDQPTAISFYRLAARQLRSLVAIRFLCSTGLDTNARLQLRLLYETSLLWTRFRIDAFSLAEYEASTGSRDANAFWHKYLSRGKTEKYLKDELSKRGFIWIGEMEDALQELKEKMSFTAHPSQFAGCMDASSDWHNDSSKTVIGTPSTK